MAQSIASAYQSRLKSCPYCACTLIRLERKLLHWHAQCTYCLAIGNSCRTDSQAILDWNKQAMLVSLSIQNDRHKIHHH